MKKQTGSGRRGGARRTKPESKAFLPKRKLSQNSAKNTENEGGPGTKVGAKKGGKFSAKGKPKVSKTRTGGYKSEGRRRRPEARQKPLPDSNAPMRLNRFVAQAGICSRRDADVLIAAGVVSVNGEIITEMGFRVLLTMSIARD